MLIGITGRIASGKGEVAKYFEKKGFNYTSLSSAVREEAAKRGIDVSTEEGRKKLQDLGNLLREQEGAGAWVKKIAERISLNRNYVIDGIRNPGEIEQLRTTYNFWLISVNATKKIRYQRVITRAKSSDPQTWEEFLEMDKRDFGEEDPFGQQVGKCMEMADFHLVNNSTLEDFYKRIEEVYNKISEKC